MVVLGSFLIHTVVVNLTLCQGKLVEVLTPSGLAAYLLDGKTIHTFFRLGINLECFLEWGTIDCSKGLLSRRRRREDMHNADSPHVDGKIQHVTKNNTSARARECESTNRKQTNTKEYGLLQAGARK